ncbi:hypothetical protein DSO57_1000123 [Entomophthora muscae]|uniref:Uncharacterized protein n=1 Tax=Entomophthora muscae TaxID=34485 RepID=A0ACC2SMN5_9FUNG|nr:hypothetical protein DSO57_1000123 [Entomophthora muscae]
MVSYIVLFITSTLCLDDLLIDRAKLGWLPCERPMVLEKGIAWTGPRGKFRSYHLAKKREKETIVIYNDFFKEHIFEKKEETYWFGRKEKVSDILECDIRYNCTLKTSYLLHRTVATNSTEKYTFDEWKEITKPNPPHPEALTEIAAMASSNTLPVNVKDPRYIWFNPIMWGVRGTYIVKHKFGFETNRDVNEIEVYFPLKLPSGQLNGIYGLGEAIYDRWEGWKFY